MNPQSKYQIDTPENRAFLEECRQDLLRFGHQFPSPSGSSYYLSDDGSPWPDRPCETWITSRMVHVYSLGILLGHEGSEALVDAGLKGLITELRDHHHDGWFSGVTSDHRILPDKQCYAHAFVILAACSALLAGKKQAEELLHDALRCFDRFFWDKQEGLCRDSWNTEFTVLDEYRGLNANMHTVEAFLAVADVLNDERYRQRCERIIRRVVQWAETNHWRIPEHFSSDWKPDLQRNADRPDDPFKPYGATCGHGIEWARLIIQWALCAAIPDKQRQEMIEAAEHLYQRAMSDGWCADGAEGIVYTTDWNGKPVVHDRMHWTLAEAINTSACLWHLTKKPAYAKDAEKLMRYLDEKVIDPVHGSWFHQLDRHNQVIGTVWPGKPDLYHAVQATLIPYAPPHLSIAVAVKNKVLF